MLLVVHCLSKNQNLQAAFGKNVINSYIKLKNQEIKNYITTEGTYNERITNWEKNNTLDC